MEFTTHNQQDIDTSTLTDETVIKVTADELTALFGKGIEGKPMWRVLFKDENVAFIYPCGDDSFYVESRSKQGLMNVQITIDLHREQTAVEKKDPIEKALESAHEIMDSLRGTKGEGYARLVEMGMLVRKNQDLLHAMIGAGIAGGELPEHAGELVAKISAHMNAKMLSLASHIADPEGARTKEHGKELMDWVDKMIAAEGKAVTSLIGDLGKRGDD